MKKINVLWAILDLVFLLVFNIIFFLVSGSNQVASVWIAYGFIHFSYLMLLVTPFLIRKGSSAAVLGFPLYIISAIYFFTEFVVGIVVIFIASETYKVSLILQIIIAAIYAVMLISNMIANEHTADSIERHEEELLYVKESSTKLNGIAEKISDRIVRKQVEKLYDLVHSSQVKSHNSVSGMEYDIIEKIEQLDLLVQQGDKDEISSMTATIYSLAEERNRRLKNCN